MGTFNPHDYTAFVYESYDIAGDFRTIKLNYALVGETASLVNFTETIAFPELDDAQLDSVSREAATRVIRLLFLAAGLSYYKVAAPAKVTSKLALTAAESYFLKTLIGEGMTEFAYVNNMPQALHPAYELPEAPAASQLTLTDDDQPVVPVGGGKDSIVTIEALRTAGFHPHLFSVKTYAYGAIAQTAAQADLPYGFATRELSPKMRELNDQGALSGHIPITAVVSLISILFAVLNGHKTVVISSERSASTGNVMWQGIEVNHQWSKSLALETLLRQTLATAVSPGLEYFSLLRPLSELQIARYFASLRDYHKVFSSCNRAFLAPESANGPYWCGHCPKCRFVFLVLVAFLPRQELEAIFGGNLFATEGHAQQQGFRELLGIEGHKPLECVGEIEESRWALAQMARNSEWKDEPMLTSLMRDIPTEAMPTPEQEAALFTPEDSHFIPEAYQEALHAIK